MSAISMGPYKQVIHLKDFRFYRQLSTSGHGIPGIGSQIKQYLADLPHIYMHLDRIFFKARNKLDIFTNNTVKKIFHIVDNLVDIDGLGCHDLLSAERQEAVGKIGRTFRCCQYTVDLFLAWIFGLHLHLQYVSVTAYYCEDIIEIMGNASGKLSNGLHLLGLAKLLLQTPLIGHIDPDTRDADNVVVGIVQDRVVPHDFA
jgi:hypothetical protein